jgi:2',3'-cyclic-nucleotide 2'-phosphodiesterase (5'-nucleotidase family)
MKFGTRVMSYGFLFNFAGNANNTVVQPSNVTVTLPWFQKSLKEDVDVYLVVGHVPVRWAESLAVIKAIRAVHPSKPILLFGGHLHVRDFIAYDGRAYGLAAGRFMETLGWMSVSGIHDHHCRVEANCVGKNLTVSRRYLDTNVHTYKTHSLAHHKQKFDTWRGRKITHEITQHRQSLNLSNAFGCAPQDYYLSRYPVTDNRSLFNLLTKEVLPFSIIDKTRANPAVVLINTGCQRFDVSKGPFTYDDTFIVSPFHDDFAFASVPYKVCIYVLTFRLMSYRDLFVFFTEFSDWN